MANVFKSMMPGGGENAAAAGGGGGGEAPWWLKYAGKVAGVGAGIGKWKRVKNKVLDSSMGPWFSPVWSLVAFNVLN